MMQADDSAAFLIPLFSPVLTGATFVDIPKGTYYTSGTAAGIAAPNVRYSEGGPGCLSLDISPGIEGHRLAAGLRNLPMMRYCLASRN